MIQFRDSFLLSLENLRFLKYMYHIMMCFILNTLLLYVHYIPIYMYTVHSSYHENYFTEIEFISESKKIKLKMFNYSV